MAPRVLEYKLTAKRSLWNLSKNSKRRDWHEQPEARAVEA